jgi:hypothetical protein
LIPSITFVDDVGVAAPTEKLIDEFIEKLRQKGFELEKEGSFAQFLGIKFERNQREGSIELTQKGLISKIIAVTGLQSCKPNLTPASQLALGRDEDGEPMDELWGYSSVIGMLLYLSTNTRPDISFVVSQAAWLATTRRSCTPLPSRPSCATSLGPPTKG